ncbi:MAG: spore germination protein GerW family protein [Dehalococcoidia bacterium]
MNDTASAQAAMSAPAALDRLARLPEFAGASACFGEAVTAGERTVIPVAEVQYGLGFGWGGGRDAKTDSTGLGGGAGGGARSRAVAVIEVAPDSVRVLPIEDYTQIRLASIAFVSTTVALVARTFLKLIRG